MPASFLGVSTIVTDLFYLTSWLFKKCGIGCRKKLCGRWRGFGKFSEDQQLDEDIEYLKNIQNQDICDYKKIAEQKRIFEHLIQNGKISILKSEDFLPAQILGTGIPATSIVTDDGWTVLDLIEHHKMSAIKLYRGGIVAATLSKAGVTFDSVKQMQIDVNDNDDIIAKRDLWRQLEEKQ